MSHIPSSAVPHAKPHDDHAQSHGETQSHGGAKPHDEAKSTETQAKPTDESLVREDPTLGNKAAEAAKSAKIKAAEAGAQAKAKASDAADYVTEAVKAHPKTAIGIGAAVVAGIAAVVAAPAVIAKVKESNKPAGKKADKKADAKKAH